MHTRKLRQFIAVAEELHFSRAAAKLFVAQQALSRQIRELEEELGTRLFLRSTRKVELTPAGEAFLEGARSVVEALDRTVALALHAGQAVKPTLRVGSCVGGALELTAPILSGFRSRYPEVELEWREYAVTDTSAGLADGTSDIAIIRLPISVEGIESVALFTEPLVAIVASSHRLADRTDVAIDELLEDPITVSVTQDEAFRAFWSLVAFRGGVPPQVVPIQSVTEESQVVSAGSALSIMPAAAARYGAHPSLRFLPITDAPVSAVALAWRADSSNPLLRRFRKVALAVRDRETALVAAIERPPHLIAGSR